MAQLKQNVNVGSGLNIEHEAPPGQYVAVCLRVVDVFGVMRKKFQSQEEAPRDVTRFIFGVLDQQNRAFLIQTFEFTISAAPGSNLIDFLTGWLGREPEMGWDYVAMTNQGAMITVAAQPSKRNPAKVYANITGISPVFPALQNLIPHPDHFRAILEAAMKPRNDTPAPAPQGGPGYQTPTQQPPSYAQPQHAPAPQPIPQRAPAPLPAPVAASVAATPPSMTPEQLAAFQAWQAAQAATPPAALGAGYGAPANDDIPF